MNDIETLQEARQHVQDHVHEGVVCPCCDRHIKVYARRVTRVLVEFLRALYRMRAFGINPHRFVEVSAELGKDMARGDYSKLAYWNLIEQHPEHTGLWRVTPEGVAFLNGSLRIPVHAFVLRNEVLGYSDDTVDVSQAFGSAFSLDEVMAPVSEVRRASW